MNPDEINTQPAATTVTTAAPTAPKKMTGRTKLALWLLIAPTGLFIASFILYIIGAIISSVVDEPAAVGMFSSPAAGQVALNVVAWIVGVVGFMTWLPGLITGIVLLATKK